MYTTNGIMSCLLTSGDYRNWQQNPQQPDDEGNREDCVMVNEDKWWNDAPCDSATQRYLCKTGFCHC